MVESIVQIQNGQTIIIQIQNGEIYHSKNSKWWKLLKYKFTTRKSIIFSILPRKLLHVDIGSYCVRTPRGSESAQILATYSPSNLKDFIVWCKL